MSNKIQYRINNDGDIRITDLESNQIVSISHKNFNEIRLEVRSRMLDKKYKNKKVEFEDVYDLDPNKVNNVLSDLVYNRLVPEIVHELNDTMTENKISLSMSMVTAVIINMVNGIMYNILAIYPPKMRMLMAVTMALDIGKGISKITDLVEKNTLETDSIIDVKFYEKLRDAKNDDERKKILNEMEDIMHKKRISSND